jgi:hypothetical protein
LNRQERQEFFIFLGVLDVLAVDSMSETITEDYRVPGEPGVFFCARHRNVKTRLRCGRCEKPICPKCTKFGPTGARCADCASNRTSHMYQVKPWQFVLAFLVAFGCSLLGSLAATFSGFFLLFYAPLVGTLIGKAIVRVVKGKRGVPLAVVSCGGVVLGALMPLETLLYHAAPFSHLLSPFPWIYLVLAISGVWYWVR